MQISQLNKSFSKEVVNLIRVSDKDFSWSDKQVIDSLTDDMVFGLINDNQELLAVAIFSKIFETVELLYICVLASNQKKGLGYQILQKSLNEFSKKSEVENIFLEVDVNNQSAIKLYNKLNFREISKRKNYYKKANGKYSDALIYQLKI
ncbi:alanine acetyltransferase [Candidatus Francisella endociliophora]|uniref:Alanine acetyltransferase n=1 Tax=Candidatus Francisella endociliophora TaxID=653937 RepID=A0A097ERP6_9GAMM|nr:GNAT family N-acetyltransferase [Francisella sp. FSC1006]AIT10248.1 alanine acetyltransferase [Francisella sp. FSC1006]